MSWGSSGFQEEDGPGASGVEVEGLPCSKPKAERGSIAQRMHFIDTATLLAVGVPSPVNNDAVAGFERGLGLYFNVENHDPSD